MLKRYLFVDLDDTLFQSQRKCPHGASLTPMADSKKGRPHSFATPVQKNFLDWMEQTAHVIPVTARHAQAFARVRWPFRHGAVINFGGLLLDASGQPEAAWLARSQALAEQTLPVLKAAQAAVIAIARTAQLRLHVRLIENYGVPFYINIKSDHKQVLNSLWPHFYRWYEAAHRPLRIYRNGRHLALLPWWLDKGPAVAYLIERLQQREGEILTLGMGDSLSDLGFMHLCDYTLLPQKSQINTWIHSSWGAS